MCVFCPSVLHYKYMILYCIVIPSVLHYKYTIQKSVVACMYTHGVSTEVNLNVTLIIICIYGL